MISSFFSSTTRVFGAAVLLRTVLLLYGLWQDTNSPVKYTDIDYLVFTDAATATANGGSPYDRETYRYTPLLAWMLLPTTWGYVWPSFGALPHAVAATVRLAWFSSGKVLFAVADLVAGWLIVRLLTNGTLLGGSKAAVNLEPREQQAKQQSWALQLASIWLLNPMVATISTRGSSEGLLCAVVMALLCAVVEHRFDSAAILLGFAVHFKIYPFIYAPAIIWWMDAERLGQPAAVRKTSSKGLASAVVNISWPVPAILSPARVRFGLISLATFSLLNLSMFAIYGTPFIAQTYLHHITRIDHRHNFSPYNMLLYLSSSGLQTSSLRIESLAFLPQLLLSTVLIPLALAKKNLAIAMLAQTFAFVTFNKVCTSQYFLWYLVLIPLYLPFSSLSSKRSLSFTAVALWALGQAAWLREGYQLEFLGLSTFVPGLLGTSLGFFLVNCWLLSVIIDDGARAPRVLN